MIREADFQTYLYLNNTQYIIYVTDNKTNEKIYSERLAIEENFTELKFSKLDEFLDFNILKIEKTNFLASTNINGKNYLVGSNGKLINTKDYSQNLPFIFGNFEIKKFIEFKNIILQTNFKYNNIKNFYYFPSGRWDIEMISGVLIKLPITGIKESLNLSIDLLNDIEFSDIKILDIRQKNQIVIND